ncbi:hypothetical protein NKG94_37555 [Micromonospora sp. M12]
MLGEYRHDRLALTVYLATLQTEASAHLAEVDPARLTERFLSWAAPVPDRAGPVGVRR